MAFNYTPASDEQLEKEANERKEANLLVEGEYDFEIALGSNHVSATSGKESIKLQLLVFKDDGTFVTIYDYITPAYMFKFKHAAQACGLETEYNAGSLDGDMFSGQTGKVLVGRQAAQNGYGPKNIIKDYIVGAAPVAKKTPKQVSNDLDDEIPF